MKFRMQIVAGTVAAAMGAAALCGQEGLLTVSSHHSLITDMLGTIRSQERADREFFFEATRSVLEGVQTEIKSRIQVAEDTLQNEHLFTHLRIADTRNEISQLSDLNQTHQAELLSRLDLQDAKLLSLEAQVDQVMQAVIAVGDQNLRMRIEEHLSMSDDDPRHQRIASFQLPAAAGGELELVRQIVLQTYQMHVVAGLDTHPLATQEVGLGDAAFSNGQYPEAFDHFRNAYRLIVY